MTDFIHEAPPPEEQTPKEPEKPTTEKERQKRVYTYIAVLFTAAFLLILWSFFSTHRSNQEVIDQIKGSQTMMQSTLDENHALQSEISTLEKTVNTLEDERDALAKENETLRENMTEQGAMISALDWLCELEKQYAEKDRDAAKSTILMMEDNGISAYLFDHALHTSADGDYGAPAARYEEIVNALFPEGIN